MAGWALLDVAKYANEFECLFAFSYELLHDEKPAFQIAYNFECNKIDFKAISHTTKKQITIGFELGYPQTMVTNDN